MDKRIVELTDSWLGAEAPRSNVAVSSRTRYARNLAGFPFVPHARAEVLERVSKYLHEAIGRSPLLRQFERVELATLSSQERSLLKETRLISKEMENGGSNLAAYLSPDGTGSILVNEEDHVRLQVITPGLQVAEALRRLDEMDRALSNVVGYAYSERYGYLTACPTNVGTGFRASVMLHLPGLTLLHDVEASLQGIAHYGLTVRGFHGENSDFNGDFYQISNEITLGKTTGQIVEMLMGVIERISEREEEGRLTLFKNHSAATEDHIWRSFALLSNARKMDSAEAMTLLSRLRLGIDHGYFPKLAHHALTRLVMEIQPAHLERRRQEWKESASRDEARANYLREQIARAAAKN